ncbi:proline iminopeptidase-family hydrolase [Natronocalculus amylovorans]|uniref:Proline iminopeptidase n=1 Tax=Natronocalculus amylovorans TaxID=2917812 RepID=A0AAE3K712_9EURY|nr:proline iminopeptidase-family hydrolase [Natronocalculus amylovorans]MCL9815578.1 proline iminopeptidase-family hydrolase [Natronocalculus amylovorans]
MTRPDGLSDPPSLTPYFDVPHTDGYASLSDGYLYYRKFGTGENVLIGLHGGPGSTHDYLAPVVDLLGDDWTIYLYDQFGCGRSKRPPDGEFDYYTVEGYRDRLDAFRQAIGVETVTLYGHSWGGMLAQEYALAYPEHVQGLVLANTLSETQRAAASMRAAASSLSTDDRELFDQLVEARAFDDDRFSAFDEAIRENHVLRTERKPLHYEIGTTFNMDIYGLMWGQSEFVVAETARLRGWDVTDEIPAIDCPTLVLSGEYDEIEPSIAEEIAATIPGAELFVFSDASHMPFWEQREKHQSVVSGFLSTVV